VEKSERTERLSAGRAAVLELLRSTRPVDSLFIARGKREGLAPLITLAKERGVPVKEVSPVKLDALCPGVNHQGVAASAAQREYAELSDLLAAAAAKGEAPFLALCDEIEDPHNLGAIIRTAEAAGAHGIVIPRHRSVGLTYAVAKAACGALEHLPVARVANMADAVDTLKASGVFVYAADMAGRDFRAVDFAGPAALVVGSEGKGIRPLVKARCDDLVSIPMRGAGTSLNASVAAGILLFEISRSR